MKQHVRYNPMATKVMKVLGAAVILLMLAIPSFSQNTKGDKPTSGRESRFRKSEKKRAVSTRKNNRKTSDLRAYKPRGKAKGGERTGSPIGRSRRIKARPTGEHARHNIYSQKSIYVHNNSRKRKDGERRPITRAVGSRGFRNSSPGRKDDKPYQDRSRVAVKPAKVGSDNQPGRSNRTQLNTLRKLQGRDPRPGRKQRVSVRSSSRSYIARKTINIQARFPRPKRKVEKAYTKDISGRRIRTKNYESPKPKIISPQPEKKRSASGKVARSKKTQDGSFGRFRNYSSSAYDNGGRALKRRIVPKSISSTIRKIYPQSGPYVSNPSKNPRSVERGVSNRSALAKLQGLQSVNRGPGRKRTVKARSASRSFLARKSTNVWAHFPRPKKRGERATTRDIAGKPLRTRNYQSPRQEIISPGFSPYQGRKRVSDRPYRGPAAGGYSSASGMRPRPWYLDIAKRKIRGIKTPRRDSPSRVSLGGYRSATKHGEKRAGQYPLPVKQPGIWGEVLRHATGKITGRRPVKGGGSRSGKLWNNKGSSLAPRIPGSGAPGVFQGNIKRDRPIKGGGSVSGRLWNNKGNAIAPRLPRPEARDPGLFQGHIKRDRPIKGGGSVSGSWNNKGNAIAPRLPRAEARDPGLFQGNIKRSRPLKGGGSVSGRVWNNKGNAIDPRLPRAEAREPGLFQGNIKAQRPIKGGGSVSGKTWNNRGFAISPRTPKLEGAARAAGTFQGNIKVGDRRKGGGSISGRLWNNSNTAISPKLPPKRAREVNGYPGKMKMFEGQPGFEDQGEEFTGFIKVKRKPLKNKMEGAISVRRPGAAADKMKKFQGNLKAQRPLKGGGSVSGQLWNNKNTPLAVRTPGRGADGMSKYQGTLKATRPVKGGGSVSGQLWNNREEPINVRPPGRSDYDKVNYTGNVKLSRFRRSYVKNPNSSQAAMLKQRPSKNTYTEDKIQTKVRQYNYVKNSNSSKDALRTREPGRSFARAADFQGNIKMQKFRLFEKTPDLHPDATFVRTNKNNVAGEKDPVTNFKLWWARLFRKNETQPDNLKYKGRKPRYDKGEQGLWYD